MLGFVRPFWEVLFRHEKCERHWRCRRYWAVRGAGLKRWIDFYLKLCYTYVSNRVVLLSYFSFFIYCKIQKNYSPLERTFFTKCTFSLLYLTENLFDVIVYWLIITLSHLIYKVLVIRPSLSLQGSDLWLLYPFQNNSLLTIVSRLRWWSFDHYLFSQDDFRLVLPQLLV